MPYPTLEVTCERGGGPSSAVIIIIIIVEPII
jgi:hypothetical protein